MKCPICKKSVNCVCSCGYCKSCIEEFGHKGCIEITEHKKIKSDGDKNENL